MRSASAERKPHSNPGWAELQSWHFLRERLPVIHIHARRVAATCDEFSVELYAVTGVTRSSGRTVNCTYDGIYRLTNETITLDSANHNGSVSYGLDPVGNRQTEGSSLSGIPSGSWNFNADDELSSETYDSNGNVLSTGGKTFTYDSENHLTSMNGSAVTIVYDGDGNRVAKTVNGVTTRYLVDDLNPTGYTQVVEELVAGAVSRQYSYGLQRIDEYQLIGGTWTASFYGYDGGGNVRNLTNSAGTVTDTYEYDAFGNKWTVSGTTPNNYLYRGEEFDPDLGLNYLRARYYNPATGRFMSRDPENGIPTDPETLHKYLYAGGDPVDKWDPSGRDLIGYAMNLWSRIKTAVAVAQMGKEDVCVLLYAAETLECASIVVPGLREECLVQAEINLFRCTEGLPPWPDF